MARNFHTTPDAYKPVSIDIGVRKDKSWFKPKTGRQRDENKDINTLLNDAKTQAFPWTASLLSSRQEKVLLLVNYRLSLKGYPQFRTYRDYAIWIAEISKHIPKREKVCRQCMMFQFYYSHLNYKEGEDVD